MLKRFTYLIFTMAALLSTACDTELHELAVCTYTVQLRYDYNEENTTRQNQIEYWVTHIDEYIFDENDILYQIRRVTQDVCTEYLNSEIDLLPGRYSVVAVGNVDSRSTAWDAATGAAPQTGRTRREDMRLSLEDPDTFSDGTKGPCEEIFYGYRTFTVEESGASRVRVDMINAHFQLRFRVRWKNTAIPSRGTYYAVLENIPSEYRLMPEYVYPAGSFQIQKYNSTAHDEYLPDDNRVIHYLPNTCYRSANLLTHSNTTYLNADNEVWGQFVNYRIKTDTEPILTLYYSPSGTRADSDPMVLPREIDLQGYFNWYSYELDYELKQEYVLDIVIDGDQIIINPLNNLSVVDWTDGGPLN